MSIAIFATKPKPSVSAENESVYNPYLAARREWDERYGDQISRARNWRVIAVLCALLALVLAAGLIWQSSRSRVVPFIAVIDSFGRPVVTGLADQTTTTDERLKKATVLQWVEELRTVTTDGIAQRKAIDRVYSHIANNSPAMAFVSDFYRANQPFEKAKNETISVDVRSVLPTSDRSFEVDWLESSRDLYGAVKSEERWKGTFTIATNPPSDERVARVNPLGLYVVSANWSRILQ